MRPPEFWVMRIVAEPNRVTRGLYRPGEGRDCTEAELLEIARLAENGSLTAFSGGDGNMFLQPIAVYDEQQLADERHDREAREHPAERYLVVVNADVD